MKTPAAIIVCGIWVLFNSAVAQTSDKIETDRGGKAQTPFIAPAQMFQVETGVEYDNKDNQHTIQHPEVLLKYGLFKRMELRTRIITATEKYMRPSHKQSGLHPVEIGLKTFITRQKGALPYTSLTTQFGIPHLASKDFKADKVFPTIRLNMQNDLSETFDLEYNVAAEWDGFQKQPSWNFSFSPHYELHKNWQVFIESFGILKQHEKPEVSIDAGLLHWLSDNFNLDITTGLGLTNEAPKFFIDGGISFRIK